MHRSGTLIWIHGLVVPVCRTCEGQWRVLSQCHWQEVVVHFLRTCISGMVQFDALNSVQIYYSRNWALGMRGFLSRRNEYVDLWNLRPWFFVTWSFSPGQWFQVDTEWCSMRAISANCCTQHHSKFEPKSSPSQLLGSLQSLSGVPNWQCSWNSSRSTPVHGSWWTVLRNADRAPIRTKPHLSLFHFYICVQVGSPKEVLSTLGLFAASNVVLRYSLHWKKGNVWRTNQPPPWCDTSVLKDQNVKEEIQGRENTKPDAKRTYIEDWSALETT